MPKLKVTANIATQPSRLSVLSQMLKSIENQVDEVRICLNEFESVPKFLIDHEKVEYVIPKSNLTDNGKFFFSGWHKCNRRHEYYFTMDDDIIYPPDYVKKTIANIEKYGCIVTYHGRLLRGIDLDYYREHQFYSCMQEQVEEFEIDVCGTGVTAFRTDYFCPSELAFSPFQRMSDVIFSLEAAKQGKTIGICSRPQGWIKALTVNDSIYDHFRVNSKEIQKELANEIFTIRYRDQATIKS